MGEQVATSTTEGAAETAAPALTLDAVKALVAEERKTIETRYNGELARLRKRLGDKPEPEARAEQPETERKAPPALTQDDLRASREIGKLEAKLPDAVRDLLEADDEFQGRSPAVQAAEMRRLLAAVEAARSAEPSARGEPEERPERAQTRGESPQRTPARAHVPARRDGAGHPRTFAEWLEIVKSDPKRAKALEADDSFDPSTLMRKV